MFSWRAGSQTALDWREPLRFLRRRTRVCLRYLSQGQCRLVPCFQPVSYCTLVKPAPKSPLLPWTRTHRCGSSMPGSARPQGWHFSMKPQSHLHRLLFCTVHR
ncbi:hypothetical protein HDV64DRAFT_30442 [Trichoderma sp. TUCIM 5745]